MFGLSVLSVSFVSSRPRPAVLFGSFKSSTPSVSEMQSECNAKHVSRGVVIRAQFSPEFPRAFYGPLGMHPPGFSRGLPSAPVGLLGVHSLGFLTGLLWASPGPCDAQSRGTPLGDAMSAPGEIHCMSFGLIWAEHSMHGDSASSCCRRSSRNRGRYRLHVAWHNVGPQQ